MKNAKRILLFVSNISSPLAYESGRRHKIARVFFFGMTLVALGYAPTSIRAQEAPSVFAQANAPGWITVNWEHTGRGASHYLVQRQEPPFTWVHNNHVGQRIDMGLNAGTTYKYRVCAVDSADKETCSPWISVTTMPPESPGGLSPPVITSQEATPDRIRISWRSTTKYGSFNVRWFEKGAPNAAAQVNVKGNVNQGSYEIPNRKPGRTYVVMVQGCNSGAAR